MPSRRECLVALSALAALPAWAAAPPAPIRVPPLPLRERRLDNGLQVLALPAQNTATVSVQVWYRVGGKDDPSGRSGFAHLFEHMMFKGSRHMGPHTFDRLTEDVGGHNNAFTAEDVTAYFSSIPANHLERLLWAEAERMGNLVVDQANFDSERAVVQEEYRQRVLANPYGRLFNALPQQGYIAHPYKRPVIGSIADLNAATLEDVRQFHATYYRPDNATLIVSGNFEPAQLDAWVDRYFGPVARPERPIPRVTVQEPRRTENSRAEVFGPNVPLPAVALIWQGPRADSKDAAALHVASALLSGGESSRLNEALVYREQTAQSAGFSADLNTDAGLLVAYAIAAGKGSTAQLEQALLREIERLASRRIPDAELEKVRTQLLTGELSGRQTPHGRAQSVGWAVIQRNDPRAADRELAELQAVRAADVQRVLKSHVLERPRVTLDYTEKKA
ncbi:M16 family metallopeptidase [Azohydromonas caseinilytica]|uniref:Insulinase family protein n=1 Tax=Azohydromonas caseinilytica TaxID=2728836 RepID=A0A848F556_9BURK|nr:pitrilysin family protein [Azohydromonas caseinilytica]NML13835.1 insulinase family protein [Azohydromonas caseinilytica]